MQRTGHFISQHITSIITYLLLGFTLVLQSPLVKAETVTFVRDYTYNASENDSKVSARTAALEQLQRAAIEEVGVQVESSVVSNKSVVQGKLKEEMLLNFKLFSQALTKTKILEEKWNGESFYLKAEIEVDPNGITTAMNTLSTDKVDIDICADNLAKLKALFQNPANIERNQAIVDIALTTEFDNDCNKWQYDILSSLIRYPDYPTTGYREFIFNQLETQKSYELPHLTSLVISYVIAYSGDTTETEWKTILKAIKSMPSNKLHAPIRSLGKLEEKIYQDKINDIIELILSKASTDKNVDKEAVIQTIIKITLEKHKQIAAKLYLKYESDLLDIDNVTPIISKIYKSGYSRDKNNKIDTEFAELAEKVINTFFQNNDITEISDQAKRSLYEIMRPIINARQRPSYDPSKDEKNKYIRDLLKRYPNQFASIIEAMHSRSSEIAKNLILLEYNLPANDLCSPIECAQQVFNRKLSMKDKDIYLKYLIAYGSRADEAEDDIIKLLDRARTISKSNDRSKRKKVLMEILININTTNTKAIDLIIENVKDNSRSVVKVAIKSLAAIGLPAFDKLKIHFNELDALIKARLIEMEQSDRLAQIKIRKENNADILMKQRIIEVIALMSPTKKVVPFLKSVPTSDNLKMNFAIEDAIAIHDI